MALPEHKNVDNMVSSKYLYPDTTVLQRIDIDFKVI